VRKKERKRHLSDRAQQAMAAWLDEQGGVGRSIAIAG
jgi:hypothetical protein